MNAKRTQRPNTKTMRVRISDWKALRGWCKRQGPPVDCIVGFAMLVKKCIKPKVAP